MKKASRFLIIDDLKQYGDYRLGLSTEEVDEYLRCRARNYARYKKCSTPRLRTLFNKMAGVNTMAVISPKYCKKSIVLMYRYDVKRFADKMFLGTLTYFD